MHLILYSQHIVKMHLVSIKVGRVDGPDTSKPPPWDIKVHLSLLFFDVHLARVSGPISKSYIKRMHMI